MTNAKNYYQILGVSCLADNEEIKKAYRDLARKYHPDISTDKNAAIILTEINQAYNVLSRPQKRKQYDLFHLDHDYNSAIHFLDIQDIYQQIIILRKKTVQLNKYRMDKDALFYELLPLLSNENINIINQSAEVTKKKNLSEEVLGINELLEYKHQKEIANMLLKINIDNGHVYSFLKQQKTIHFFQQYKFLFAVIVAVVLILALMNIF